MLSVLKWLSQLFKKLVIYQLDTKGFPTVELFSQHEFALPLTQLLHEFKFCNLCLDVFRDPACNEELESQGK